AEQAPQAAGNLAVRQPGLLVEFDDRGLSVGAQLSRGGTQGVGRLQGMATLDPSVALTPLADVEVELPVDGLAGDFHLELLGDVGLVEQATAVGAGTGQGGLVDLVDLLGAGAWAVGLGAVVLAGLAARRLGLAGGRSLGEGGGLALASAGRLVGLAA